MVQHLEVGEGWGRAYICAFCNSVLVVNIVINLADGVECLVKSVHKYLLKIGESRVFNTINNVFGNHSMVHKEIVELHCIEQPKENRLQKFQDFIHALHL